MSLKAQILGSKLRSEDVSVTDWGCVVRVQSLTGRERMELIDIVLADDEQVQEGTKAKPFDQVVLQLIYSLRDAETGDRLFGVEDHDDIIDKLSYQILEKLTGVYLKLNRPQADLEDVKKNS